MSEGLDFRVAPIIFDKGLDTRTQRKLVVAGKWDTLINVSLSENGSLKRRDGFAQLSTQNGNGLLTRGDELLIVNGGALTTVTSVGGTRQAAGEVPFVDVDKFEVVSDDTSQDMQDMACDTVNGFACYVWRSRSTGGAASTGLFVTVVDLATGARIINKATLISSATAVSPRVVMANNTFYIFYIDGADLFGRIIVVGTQPTLGAQTSLVNDADMSSKNFDACPVEFTGPGYLGVVVMFMKAAPDANSVSAIRVDDNGAIPAVASGPTVLIAAANVTEASICGVACRSFGAAATRLGFYVLHTAGGALAGGLIGITTNANFAVDTGPLNISATVPPVNSACHVTATAVSTTSMQIFFDQQSSYGTANIRPLQAVTASVALVVSVDVVMIRSACFRINAAEASGPQGPFIAGKAFTSGSSTFLPVMVLENYFRFALGVNTDTVSAQCSFWLLDTTPLIANTGTTLLVAGALYGTLGLLDTTLGGGAPTVSTPGSTPALPEGFGICLQERGRLLLTRGINMTPVGLSHITLTPQTRPPLRDELGEWAFTAGGLLGTYDGQQVNQNGFPMYPEGISAVVNATAAGALTVGVHAIVFVYEWTDGAGNRHQSALSLPVSVTVANATDQIDCLVPTTQLPQQANNAGMSAVSIVAYMTAASGTVFYRCPSAVTAAINIVTASTVAYNIGVAASLSMTDAFLTTNEPLYAQPIQAGTTLPNITSGPLHGIGVSQERLWGFLSDEPGEYTYSQEPRQNTGLQFNPDALTGRLPSTAGRGVVICELDEKTILFAERGLFVVFGTGPTPSGGFNNFSTPKPIPSDVGCVEARSVLTIPPGVIFKSEKGWYLLGRDLSVRFIGDGVERYNGEDVSSAVMMGDRQEARFSSVSGPTLVYSYLEDAWSVFYMGNLLHSGSVTDAAWWAGAGRFVHLQASTGIFPGLMQDTPGVYVDGAGAASPLQAFIFARTAFLHVSALAGFQRVRHLYLTAEAASAPTGTLIIGADFDGMYAGSPGAYTTTANLAAISFPSVEAIDLRHKLARMKCSSVAFSFLENAAGTVTLVPLTGYQALAVEVGLKRGVNRLPAGQNAG